MRTAASSVIASIDRGRRFVAATPPSHHGFGALDRLDSGAAAAASEATADDALGLDSLFDCDGAQDVEAATDDAATPPPHLQPAADETQLAVWIERIVGRDERALAALYDATAGRVWAVALRITQCRAMAEEVLEDTYWQVWRQAPRFDPARGRVLAWLLAMARSRAIDTLRHERRFAHDAMPDDDLGSDIDSGASAAAAPDQIDAARGATALHAALTVLDPRARQLVSLAFLRGLTHEEVAAQTRLPLGTVKSLIRRSLQQLRQHLESGHAAR